jgi:hypothetical protein
VSHFPFNPKPTVSIGLFQKHGHGLEGIGGGHSGHADSILDYRRRDQGAAKLSEKKASWLLDSTAMRLLQNSMV